MPAIITVGKPQVLALFVLVDCTYSAGGVHEAGVHCRASAGTGNSLRVGKAQQDPELRSALHLLSRNVGALLAHTAGPTLHKLPSDLSVFAKLESEPLQACPWPLGYLLHLLA